MTAPATTETRTPRRTTSPWWGLGTAVLVLALSMALPPLFGWATITRNGPGPEFPPIHGFWEPKVGPGTLPALALAALGVWLALEWAERLPWRRLLAASFVLGLAWLLALAFVDGTSGIDRVLGNPYEYLQGARDVTDVGSTLSGFIERIPKSAPDNWVTHIAGHPPGALLFFVVLVRLGLGGDFTAGIVVTVIAATTAPAVLATVRALGREDLARRVAPFLVLTPAAVFMAVSADAMFAAVAAWGLAALALGATASRRGRTGAVAVAWSVVAGLLLGACVMLSYGLPLLGILALAVLVLARSWLPLPIAAVAALVPVLAFAVNGFAWWEAYPVLHDRYYEGLGGTRPQSYWVWGNIGALLFATGPLLGAGLAMLRRSSDRVVLLLAGAGTAIVVLADLSGMSKSEVERIWLPFVPWMMLSLALLPERWRRPGLALQVVFALVVQHLFYTSW